MRDAGPFAEWVVAMVAGLRDGTGSDVPCDGCVACCTSGQTILVEPGERAALPPHAVVDVGGGEAALAHDADGRCVLLVGGACTAYEQRPRRCRTYDCRVFPATGLAPEGDKPAIAEAAARWRFRYDTDDDVRRRDAVRMATVVLRTSQLDRTTSATQLAAAAVDAYEELL